MSYYMIDTDQLVRPSDYAKEIGINKQKMNYWIKNKLIVVKEYPLIKLTLVQRGSEIGSALAERKAMLPTAVPARSKRGRQTFIKKRESIS